MWPQGPEQARHRGGQCVSPALRSTWRIPVPYAPECTPNAALVELEMPLEVVQRCDHFCRSQRSGQTATPVFEVAHRLRRACSVRRRFYTTVVQGQRSIERTRRGRTCEKRGTSRTPFCSFSGYALRWEDLHEDLTVPGVVAGRFQLPLERSAQCVFRAKKWAKHPVCLSIHRVRRRLGACATAVRA